MSEVIFDGNDTVADTSRKTYKALKESGELSRQASQVYGAIKAMPLAAVTINELSNEALAGWEKSTISGRLGDLRDHDLIEMAGKRDDQYSGRLSKTWMVVE